MKEGTSFDHEPDANANLIAASIQCGDDAPLGHGMATSQAEGDQSTLQDAAAQDESQNVGSTEFQRSMGKDDQETQLETPLISGALNRQSEKQHVSTGHSTQPGAIAMVGRNEGNNSNSNSQEYATFQSMESQVQDDVVKASATVVMALDQGDNVPHITNQGTTKNTETTEAHVDHNAVHVNLAGSPEEDNTCSTMIEAELVTPPIEAVRVSIDEDPSTLFTMNHSYPLEPEHAPSQEHTNVTQSEKFGPISWVLLSLCIVIVLCATLIPHKLSMNNDSKDGSPSPAPSFPYGCYTSLLDVLIAQTSDDNLDSVTYVICPNTTIKVGTMNNPADNDYRYVNGDYPIMVTRENVTIQCGWDGRRDNNCVIDGGFMHVLTLQVVPMPDGSIYNVTGTNDNLLVRGITFTGVQINVGPFSGKSISLSHPGRNMRFEDCLWWNMTAMSGVIGVSRNYYQVLVDLPLEDLSIEVTFSDCMFQSIIYDSPLVFVRSQSIKLERCIFLDMQLSLVAQYFCRYKWSSTGQVVETERGCATLMYCALQSYCSMTDICVHGIEIWGDGIIVINNDTIFNREGLYLEPNTTNATCEMATLTFEGTNFTCSDVFDKTSCPLW